MQDCQSRTSDPTREDARATMEPLEARVLMAAQPIVEVRDDELVVTGTDGADQIVVSQTDGEVSLDLNGTTSTHPGSFARLTIDGRGGNDVITLDPTVTADAVIHGGAGNDSITAGRGNDRLFGGPGVNMLFGAGGDDTLVTVGGSTADRLVGGPGRDAFWLDAGGSEVVNDVTPDEAKGSVNRVSNFHNSKTTATVYTNVKKTVRVAGKKVTSVQRVATTKVVPAAKHLVGPNLVDPKLSAAATGYTNFRDRSLFARGGPAGTDVTQGQVGDCYFLAVLSSVAETRPELLRRTIVDLGDGTFAVRLRRGPASVYVRVDADLPTTADGNLAYANFGGGLSLWVPLLEKAWAAFRTGTGGYAAIDGGWMDESYKALGMAPASTMTGTGEAVLAAMAAALAAGKSVTYAVGDPPAGSGLVGFHAYTVDRVTIGADGKPTSVTLRNPWAVDGHASADGADDGFVTIPAGLAGKAMLGFTVGTFA
ncbi:MAG: Alkaline phosphatase [uncultured Phycisphaerae bacterium]|uniref:Alkaline phosphatase n=1 Tax=uncultured Phycisphaerae bacterium TaxID=904963 RepID=A0A6J4PDL6_9BACT|nr:MAG: Alkaline phosphatase [uncultured Phycisphaerae bacterium]